MAFIRIGTTDLPQPSKTLTVTHSTQRDSARDSNGVMRGQIRGRNVIAIQKITWKHLKREDWQKITALVKGNNFKVTFYDDEIGAYVTKTMYASNRSAKVWKVTRGTGSRTDIPTDYLDCTLELISTGVD